MKPWLKWSSKAEVQQWDMYPELIELLLTGCLTELIWTPRFKSSMSTPNTNLQTYWPKGISHVMSGTIFFICLTSAFSFHFAALRISAWPAALNDGEKDARTGRRRQDRGKVKADDEPGLHCLDKFFDCAESCCVENPGDTQSTLSKRLVKYRETWRKRIQSRRSVEFSRMAKRCSSGCRYEEIRRDRRRPGTPEFPWRFNKYTRRFRKTQKPKAVTKFGHTISIYQQIACCTWRRFSRSWDKDMVSARQIKWRTSISTQLFGVYFYLSFFKLQFILVKITQKKCDLPGINPRNLWDSYFKWLRGWSLTRLKLLVLQRLIGSSLCGERETTLLTDRAVQFATAKIYVFCDSVLSLRGISTEPVKAWERKSKWFLETHYLKDPDRIDGEQMEFEWTFHQDSLHWEFSTRFKRWWLNQSVNQSHVKEGSSSCQCTMTLTGENEGTEKIVLRMLTELLSTLEDSREDIGQFLVLDRRWYGTDLMSTNLMENDIKLLRTWCSTLPKADILYSVPPAHSKEEDWKAKEME